MKILNLKQGSDEWKAARLSHFTASEAPIMMGASPYMSRDDLLKYKTTKIEAEIDYYQQKIYDKGHETEAMARPLVEVILAEELYPVTGVLIVDGLPFLASYDGLTQDCSTSFEHKQFNAELFELVNNGGELEAKHYWQLEHQLLVGDIEQALFVVSDGTADNMAHLEYTSHPERRKQLIAGWKQFQADLEGYKPLVYEVQPEAKAIEELPALAIDITGEVKSSNLAIYESKAVAFIQNINTDLKTDQDFVDAEKAVKYLDKIEKELELVKKQALSKTADISHLFAVIDKTKQDSKAKRLELSKLVKSRKEAIKLEVINRCKSELAEHIESVSKPINTWGVRLPEIKADFAGAIKGKRTIKSITESANEELARSKVEATTCAELAGNNISLLEDKASEKRFLFNDLQTIVFNDSEHFRLVVDSRLAEHAKQEADRLELERETIRQEEQQKAQAQQSDAMPTYQDPFAGQTHSPSKGEPGYQAGFKPMEFSQPTDTDELAGLIDAEDLGVIRFDESGNEYELELIVRRVRIKQSDAA